MEFLQIEIGVLFASGFGLAYLWLTTARTVQVLKNIQDAMRKREDIFQYRQDLLIEEREMLFTAWQGSMQLHELHMIFDHGKKRPDVPKYSTMSEEKLLKEVEGLAAIVEKEFPKNG